MGRFVFLAEIFRRTLTRISPMINTKITYRIKFHRKLDLNNPITLNEKIQWLKLHTYLDNTLVKQCADKYAVREYIIDRGYQHILNELIAVYDSPEKIEWNKLPNSFAIKLNVGCGFNHIISDLSSENINELVNEADLWIKKSKTQWLSYSELQYKDVTPYILIEKYLGNASKKAMPEDYKVYCFNGKPTYIMVCVGREKGCVPKFYFFDSSWNLARINKDSKEAPEGFCIPKPKCFEELLTAAKDLSQPFPFVRADFYIFEDNVVFGELTFTPAGGMDTGRLPETDLLMGELLKLPNK